MKAITFLVTLSIILCFPSCDDKKPAKDSEEPKDTAHEPTKSNEHSSEINWVTFDKSVFETAKTAQKLVLLDLGANWCHWCHVMDDSTYSKPEVISYLNENFVTVKEDQDSRPDLYAAYKKYGWPATIVFNSEGEELLQLTGYQNPRKFLKALNKVVSNPVVQMSEADELQEGSAELDRNAAICRFFESIDFEKGGHKWFQRSLVEGSVEFALGGSKEDDQLKNWLDVTIENSYNLVDPVWGGVYQYSTKREWTNQHFEKLLKVHARYIKAYALYGSKYQDQTAIDQAVKIANYCFNFLDDNGPLFSNSQNADLVSGVHSDSYYDKDSVARMALGVPSIDQSQYTKENAQLAEAFVYLWAVTGIEKYKVRSLEIVDHLIKNRLLENNLVVRQDKTEDIVSLADNQAFVELLLITAQWTQEQKYLDQALSTSKQVIKSFYDEKKGLLSSAGDLIVPAQVEFTINAQMALSLNKLGHIVKDNSLNEMAKTLFELINTRQNRRSGSGVPYLMALNDQLYREPFHAELLTKDKTKDMPAKQVDMMRRVLLAPDQYVIFDWTDMSNLPEEKDFLSDFDEGTMLFCTSTTCSFPMQELEEVEDFFSTQMNAQKVYDCSEE